MYACAYSSGWILGDIFLRTSGDSVAQAALGGGEVTIHGGVQDPWGMLHWGMWLVTVVGYGLELDLGIFEVFFNVNDTVIL